MAAATHLPSAVNYRIELKPKAEKKLKSLSPADRGRVVERLRWLVDDLRGRSRGKSSVREKGSAGCES